MQPSPRFAYPVPAATCWHYTGATSILVGTGATPLERAIAHGSAFTLSVLLLLLNNFHATPYKTPLQLVTLFLLSYDTAGGAVSNMLNSCKRFYHTPVQSGEGVLATLVKNVHVFTALHVQPILAAALLEGSVRMAVVWYVVLQVAVAAVVCTPLYVRRAVAMAIVLAAGFVAVQWPIGERLLWLVPCLFVKLVLGHAVREEPYVREKSG